MSISEHIFTLSTILRNRKSQNKSTFLAFLDAEKAFDRIDRELLLYKLLLNGVKGHIYETIKAIYQESICSINVNNMLTEWFETNCGVKQGGTHCHLQYLVFLSVWQMKVSARLLEVKWLECASLNYSLLCLYNYDYEGQKTYIIKCQLLGLLGTWKWITQRRQTVKMLTTDLSLLSIWVLVMSCVNNTTIWPVNQMM